MSLERPRKKGKPLISVSLMGLSSCFLNKGSYIFILYWAPQIIVAPPYPPIFEKKRIDTRVIQGTEEKDGTSFFSLNGSFLEVTLSNVERRGNWHSWMNMRKPRANSGSPHTLRDVRSTPKPAGAFLHWHLWTSQKRKEDCMWLMDFCTVRTLGILACVHVVLTHTDAYILCMHVCTWQMPRHVQTW